MAINNEVRTQDELDRFLTEHPRTVPILMGSEWFTVRGNSRVEARGNSRVVARGGR